MLDEEKLRGMLDDKNDLILGDVADTVDEFVDKTQQYPVGFISFDLDFYSSTVHALKIISKDKRNMLTHVPLYFDDTLFWGASDFAGERLAITEFNAQNSPVKISKWHVLRFGRPFHERQWLDAMYTATDFSRLEERAGTLRQSKILDM